MSAVPMRDATWARQDPRRFPAHPYPGARPLGSWRLTADGELHGLTAEGTGWRDRASGELIGLASRRLVLGYGSNLNPSKLLSRVDGEVYAIRATVHGWAAVWCDGRRQRDASCVATLVPRPGHREVHAVLALTPEQLELMDDWEGHGRGRYERVPHAGPVLLEGGAEPPVEVYLGTAEVRPPYLVDGQPLLVSDTGYGEIDRLVRR